MKRISLCVLATVVAITSLHAQSEWRWALGAGSAGLDAASALKTDQSGFSYVVGQFRETISLGSTTLSAAGDRDIFVAKLSTSGAVIWAKSAGGQGSDIATGVEVDEQGNVFVVGHFSGSAAFGTLSLAAGGATDGFLAKLSSGGDFLWAKNCGTGPSDSYPVDIALDRAGNPVLSGFFTDSVRIGTNAFVSRGQKDGYVCRYDRNGALSWAVQIGGAGNDDTQQLALDSQGNAYVVGSFTLSCLFGTATFLASAGGDDIYLIKYDSQGTLVWAERFGGTGPDYSQGVAVDAAGNVVASGSFTGTISFDGNNLTSAGDFDVLLFKRDANGNRVWERSAGGSGDDRAYGVTLDAQGSVFVTGYFSSTIVFQPGDFLVSSGGTDVFVAKYASSGNLSSDPVHLVRAGGNTSDEGRDISVSPAGDVFVAGIFAGNAAGFSSTSLVSRGGIDLFIASTGIVASTHPKGEQPTPRVYPNPSQDGILHLSGLTSPSVVSIYAADGVCLRVVPLAQHAALNLADLPKGLYLIQIQGFKAVRWLHL